MQFSKETGMKILRYIFPLKPNSCNPQGFLHVVCLVVIGYTLKSLCTKFKIFPLKPNSFNPQGFLRVVCLVVIGYTLKSLCTKFKRIMIYKNKTWMFNLPASTSTSFKDSPMASWMFPSSISANILPIFASSRLV